MKRIIASAGLAALGAAGVQAAYVPAFTTTDKPWNLSASLRGFYDDNYQLSSGGPTRRDSFGIEVSPSAMVGMSLEQTAFAARYTYTMRWYEDRVENSADHSHQFDAWLTHTFTERYSLDVSDSFVVAQEPELIDPAFSSVSRANGNNIRNTGRINFRARVTRLLEFEVGYANNFYDYENEGAVPIYFLGIPGLYVGVLPSRSGLLDRLEHSAHIDARWQVLPQTIGVLGYEYAQTDFIGDELIAVDPNTGRLIFSNERNNRSHRIYLGADHSFRPDFTGTVRVGGQYVDYYNSPSSTTEISPYATLSLRYTYLTESYVEAGFSHSRNATDVASVDSSGGVTQDQQSSSLYASVNHRITPKLIGSIMGQVQQSEYNGGANDGDSDRLYLVGLNLEYRFNPHFSANAGYNYDKVDSDIDGRGYDRNRVYIGVRASY